MTVLMMHGDFSEAEILAAFGGHEISRAAGEWRFYPHAIACLATVAPEASSFPNAGRFVWKLAHDLGAAPHAEGGGFVTFVPPEVRAGKLKDPRAIHLLARIGGGAYTYIGEIGRSHAYSARSADFVLEHALSSELSERFVRSRWQPSWDATIGAELREFPSLSGTSRLELVRRVAEFWRGPIDSRDGVQPAALHERRLPRPLRWWYEVAGRRSGLIDGQNDLLAPDQIRVGDDGKITFYAENQGVYLWASDPEGDDPDVWGRYNEPGLPWSREGMVLSEFLLEAAIVEGTWAAPFSAMSCGLEGAIAEELARRIPRLPLKPWRWPGPIPMHFHEHGGLFMTTSGGDTYLGARRLEAFDVVRDLIGRDWDSVAM